MVHKLKNLTMSKIQCTNLIKRLVEFILETIVLGILPVCMFCYAAYTSETFQSILNIVRNAHNGL